jgi:hypothetical protein
LDWKGLKIKKSFGSRKVIMSNEVRHRSERVKTVSVTYHGNVVRIRDNRWR